LFVNFLIDFPIFSASFTYAFVGPACCVKFSYLLAFSLRLSRTTSTGANMRRTTQLPKALVEMGANKVPKKIRLCGSESAERTPNKSD